MAHLSLCVWVCVCMWILKHLTEKHARKRRRAVKWTETVQCSFAIGPSFIEMHERAERGCECGWASFVCTALIFNDFQQPDINHKKPACKLKTSKYGVLNAI